MNSLESITELVVIKIKDLNKETVDFFEKIGADLTPVDPTVFNGFLFSIEKIKKELETIESEIEECELEQKSIEDFKKIIEPFLNKEYLMLT